MDRLKRRGPSGSSHPRFGRHEDTLDILPTSLHIVQ